MKRENFEQKKARVLTEMTLKDTKAKIMKDAKAFLEGEELEPKKTVKGKWLFYFNEKYTYVVPPTSSQKTESEAESLLKVYRDQEQMFVTVASLPGETVTLPSILKNRIVKNITVIDSADLSNYVFTETTVHVDFKNL